MCLFLIGWKQSHWSALLLLRLVFTGNINWERSHFKRRKSRQDICNEAVYFGYYRKDTEERCVDKVATYIHVVQKQFKTAY